ncbi:MAG: DUF547 domain-containing protein [Oleiphilus sp.]
MAKLLKVLSFILFTSIASMSQAQTTDHAIWDGLLKKYIVEIDQGQATQVDYAGFQQDRDSLKAYLDDLSALSQKEFDALSPNGQLAFLINAYNAWTVEFILTKYPDLESIKDLGSFFRSPWKKQFIPLLGKQRSLDDIEHKLIRGSGRYQDARIHFAVNCASIGCPALRAEAFNANDLDAQLEQQTVLFLSDESRNRFTDGELQVSSIFKWYREDFEKGWSGVDSLAQFFALYAKALGLSDQQAMALQAGKLDIEFLDYDWRLNDKR